MQQAFNSIDQNWTIKASEAYIDRIKKYSLAILAFVDDQACGLIAADLHEDYLFVDAIGVLPEYMDQGIASELWAQAQNYCTQNKIRSVKLIADPNSIAYKWYMKLGFKPTGWVEMLLDHS